MSWFKKLFQIFKSEEDEYIDNVPPEKQEGGRDMDAKVLYQYPKGQFRFPLIPDEEVKEQRPPRKAERSALEKTPSESVKPRRAATDSNKTVQRNNKVPETRAGRVQKTSNRPFRPTEIPSPIYGFEKHSRKSAPVEFELDTFSNKEPSSTRVQELIVDEVNKTELRGSESTVTKMIKSSTTEQIEDQAEENEENIVVELDSQKNSFEEKIQEEVPELEPVEQGQEPNLKLDVQGTLPNTEQILEEVPQIDDELELEVEDEQELEPQEFVSAPNAVQVELPESEHEIALEEEDTESELAFPESEIEPNSEEGLKSEFESAEIELDLDMEVPESMTEPEYVLDETESQPDAENDQEIESDVEIELDEETPWESEPEQEPELEPEPKKRSHIPFNVIMLKEDRKRFEERNTAKKEIENTIAEVSPTLEPMTEPEEIAEEEYYVFPSLELLNPPVFKSVDKDWLEAQEQQLNDTLFNFNVRASVVNVTQGPSVTRFEVRPEPGVKVNKITNLADDIKLSLAAKDIRMEAPIPGTHMIGIEVPNEKSRPVLISEILKSEEFAKSTSPLTAVLGLDISGKPIVTDLRKMPHGLIAGATGSGKSVCINSMLVSLLYKADPNEVKLLLIDPKMVELAPYNQIPHLVSPVITDVKAATAALKWAVDEMERRYELFVHAGVREISRYNEIADQEKNYSVKLPYIVIVIDELADLMMMSPADVEEAIARIAQKARACGIHLIIATQRPSVDVITGLIKANVPTRIAFSVSSQIDSRTIIDISGAERLLGRGDMLFLENGSSKPVRLQGTYVSDAEIDSIVAHVRREQSPNYLFEQEELLKKATVSEEEDELFYEACEYIIEQGGASTSSLQRRFKIGYNRAARLIDMMEEQGLISEAKGSKPRDVLITESELESMQED